MATTRKKLKHDDYRVGLIYVKPLEMSAIITMLDEEHESLPLDEEDPNEYTLGKIGNHNVVVVGPPKGEQGKVAISTVVGRISHNFKKVKIGLLVGIGGGVPRLDHGHDVRLGDVVVGAPEYSPAVVQYDLGRWNTEGIIEVTRTLGKPPTLLLNVVNKVSDRYQRLMEGEESFFTKHLRRFERFPKLRSIYCRPNSPDLLFLPDYVHEFGTDCKLHDKRHWVPREQRSQDIDIHYSTILSGDLIMKCGNKRDELSTQHHNALCFEMEAAGLMDVFPCLVVRGICDYADSHKNKEWQNYAAATAAAYAREILYNTTERVASELNPSSANDRDAIGDKAEAEERNNFLKMLSFPEMNNRKHSVEPAYTNTYEWVRNSVKYKDWRSSDNGKLLIKGKAGCGKSTLMKHLYTEERRSESNHGLIVCGFFFNNRGRLFERSTDAMLRTIIHEIVFQYPASFRCLQQFYSDRKAREGAQKQQIDWTSNQLEQMFTILARLSDLKGLIYIDALDEGEGFLPSKMFEFLEKQLDTGNGLRICLSSRPSNFVNHRTAWTTIDLGNENSKDIELYTTGELQGIAEACPDYKDMVPQLCEQILCKADGVFLWAKIVVERLQKAMNRYDSEDEIWNTLEDSPDDLYELFVTCLKRVEKSFWGQMTQILQIVLVAERPLSIAELVDLMKINNPSRSKVPHARTQTRTRRRNGNAITVEDEYHQMKKKIQNWCGGLVEVVETPRSILIKIPYIYMLSDEVQFMHQSVKDFLRESAQLDTFGLVEVEATSQKLLFNWCLRYLEDLKCSKLQESSFEDSEVVFWDHVAQEHPFLIYSPLWIKHAGKCDPKKLAKDTIHRANGLFKTWPAYALEVNDPVTRPMAFLYPSIYKNNTRERDHVYSSLLAFSAHHCFINLVEALLLDSDIEHEQRELDMALFSACNWGLECEKITEYNGVPLRRYPRLDSEDQVMGVSEDDWLAMEKMVDLLIKKGADVNWCGGKYNYFQTPLAAACWWGHLTIVKRLIDEAADVNLIHPEFRDDSDSHLPKRFYSHGYATPLIAACWGGNISVAQFLIDNGALVNLRAGAIGTALAEAAYKGDIRIIKLLLDSHAKIDMLLHRDIPGSALTIAALAGKEEAVKYLVARGAETNPECPWGSPLSAAASCPEEIGTAIMEYLIEKGASVEDLLDGDNYGSILLSAVLSNAPGRDISNRIKLLIKHGVDVNADFEEEPQHDLDKGSYISALIAAANKSDYSERCRDTEVMRCLIEHGARVNEQPTVGKYGSALIAAAMNCHYERMKLLIENGADVNLPSLTGKYGSALEAITRNGCPEFDWKYRGHAENWPKAINMLLQHGADADSMLRGGSCRPEFLELLIPYVKDEALRRSFQEIKEPEACT